MDLLWGQDLSWSADVDIYSRPPLQPQAPAGTLSPGVGGEQCLRKPLS